MTRDLPKGIRRRGAKYLVDVTHEGQRKTATCSSVEEALDTRLRLLSAMRVGKEPEIPRANARTWTLQEALDKTMSLPKPDGWRGTSYGEIAALNVLDAVSYMGPDIPLSNVNLHLIDAWVSTLEAKGNSDGTVNRKVSSLRKVMSVAVKYDGLPALPRFPSHRKEAVGRIRQISAAEEHTLIDTFVQLGQLDHADAVTVLIDTGIRCSELWNVRAEDVDLKGRVLLVYGVEGKGTKNGKYRSVPMTSRVLEIMARRTNPRPFNYDNPWMRHGWDRVRGMMGLSGDKQFVPHTCRHTCASRLVRAGVSLPVVQQWLGHSTIQTTLRYAHLMPQDLMNAVAVLERNN